MRLSIAAGFVAMASMATPPREAGSHCPRRAQRSEKLAAANRCSGARTPPARTATRPSPMPRGALRVEDDAFVDVRWRGADVATAARVAAETEGAAGRAFATLAALDVKGVPAPPRARRRRRREPRGGGDAVGRRRRPRGLRAAAAGAVPW